MEEKRGDTNEKQGRRRLKGESEVRRRLMGGERADGACEPEVFTGGDKTQSSV